ncbi:hypothetical protein ACFJ96_002602 [Salmonella enterica]|nr:hypothetical protein [Salmonella enterica]EFR0321599.1 hypothetical protein [Salmonella enterica]EFV5041340.1 hypothetical protein [Salmonella enterica]EGM6222239.1 hypothetical protein [Salmonella enterica]EHG9853459.1 hypothetical protein [Salmonella enterica]
MAGKSRKKQAKTDNGEPDFSSVTFALDEYLKARCNKRKVNRGCIGSDNPKPKEP